MFRIIESSPRYTCPLKDNMYSKMHATSMLIDGIVKSNLKITKKKTYSATEIKIDIKKALDLDFTYNL